MNRAEKAFVDRLKPLFQSHGFTLRAGRYVKRQEFGFAMMAWGSYPMPENGGYQVIEPGLGIRHDRVEDIVNQLGHIWGKDNQKNTTTIYRGLALFPFRSGWEGRKIIRFLHVDEDADKAAASVEDMLRSDGFAFFDRFSSLLECSRGLNEPVESRTHPLFNNFALRAYYGVACAALAEPERVPDLIRAYGNYARENRIVDITVSKVARDSRDAEGIILRMEAVAQLAAVARG